MRDTKASVSSWNRSDASFVVAQSESPISAPCETRVQHRRRPALKRPDSTDRPGESRLRTPWPLLPITALVGDRHLSLPVRNPAQIQAPVRGNLVQTLDFCGVWRGLYIFGVSLRFVGDLKQGVGE